ncbi:ATP-binding protein [Streptomyces sp. LN785]|uniref:ATP-binding protein n=1 Tax=Streptomyces sp. LN785 TaxID=3112983 RepID=UPI0037212AFE
MTSLINDPLLWITLVVLVAGTVVVLRARRTNMALRKKRAALESGLEAAEQERHRLAAEDIGLRNRHATELAEVRQDAAEETKAVLKAAMLTLQVLADDQQRFIAQMQGKHGDNSDVLADLMLVDHTNSQFSRRAQGIAVLCGGWLGRREGIASVYDVARSAQGRIRHFDRVHIHTQVTFSVVSRVVEPVAVVLAELLANATNSSRPDTPVEVSIQAVPAGVCLIVDDYGLGMSQEEKDRAAAMLSPQAPVDITSLGNPPRFGFAVAGLLAARYGFKVSVDSVSPYGGVRAVILLPENLLTTDVPEPAGRTNTEENMGDADADADAVPSVPRPEPTALPEPLGPIGTTAGGLPKRRRRPVEVVRSQPESEPEPVAFSSEVTASRIGAIGAFQRGTQSGRETNTEGSQNQ